jgi:glycosyltransferase involved in cell wall biosynthesis
MNTNDIDISIIVPAYNEAQIIGQVVNNLQSIMQKTDYRFEIIVIDDGSSDESALEAEKSGAKVLKHPYNIGNGAAIKTGIRNASGKIFVMLDADGQHPPEYIPKLLEKTDHYDMVVGARSPNSEGALHRNIANWIYNKLASYVSGTKIDDLTSGFRAIRAEVGRNFVYLLPNQFSYPTTITLATLRSGRTIFYEPIIAKRRVGRSKIRIFRDGVQFILIILKIATFYSPLKVFFPVSIAMFLTGFFYGLFKVIFLNTRYGPTSAMLMTLSVVIFMVGLVSEQVALLRFDRSERFDEKE